MKLTEELQGLWRHAGDPHFLQWLLEAVSVVGVAAGTLLGVVSMFFSDIRLRTLALIILALSALSVIPCQKQRAKAPPAGAARAMVEKTAATRKETSWVYYTLAGFAVGALLSRGQGRIGTVLLVTSLFGGAYVTIFGLWLHSQDMGGPPPKPVKAAKPAAAGQR